MDDSGMFGTGPSSSGPTRRQFMSGVVVVGAAVGLAAATDTAFTRQAALATTPPTGPPTTTVPLPTTTAPEQLLLTWGNDPATQVTVSWSAPGTVAQPAPTLRYSAAPISATRPGRTIALPEPQPLNVARHYPSESSVSLTA